MIVRSYDGKIIGNIEEGVFTKTVKGSVHMLHTPRGWGIDCIAYNHDVLPVCHTIVVNDVESNTVYKVSLKTFDAKKVYIDRGHGGQYILLLKYWQVIKQGQTVLL